MILTSQPPAEPRAASPGPAAGMGRDRTDALILDAVMKQALVTTRSLGRAGLTVSLAGAIGTSEKLRPPSFSSRWAHSSVLLPSFVADADEYARGVIELVEREPTAVVIPLSDESISSLRPWRSTIERHSRLALASEAALEFATDKRRTLELAAELGLCVPRTTVIDSVAQLIPALAEIGCPAVVKPAVPWSRERGGRRFFPREVLDEAEAVAVADELCKGGAGGLLVQELATGGRETVCFFRVGGQVLATFALAYLRTTPVLGGASVLRESIALPSDTGLAALELVEAMDIEGYSEVEFRRDSSGRPLLMEVNARLSGSLELAVRAGVDFPLMAWKWASGRPVEKLDGYRTGVRLRWLAGDASWLMENLQRHGRPDSVPRGKAFAAFVGEFFRRDSYDFFDRKDMRPAVVEIKRLVSRVSPADTGGPPRPDTPGDPTGSTKRRRTS